MRFMKAKKLEKGILEIERVDNKIYIRKKPKTHKKMK